MDDKARWLELWNLSGEEGDRLWAEKQRMDRGQTGVHFEVMPDIQPYRSMADGTLIESRSKHREHLKRHHCIEVGNEMHHMKAYGDYTPKGIKGDLIREYQKHKEGHRNG